MIQMHRRERESRRRSFIQRNPNNVPFIVPSLPPSTSYVASPPPLPQYKPRLRPRQSPDCYRDDMAVRRLRQ